jgi:hypothetical protein
MLESPPLNVIVEACRVEGIKATPPPGGYGALLMVTKLILFVLIVLALRVFVVVV